MLLRSAAAALLLLLALPLLSLAAGALFAASPEQLPAAPLLHRAWATFLYAAGVLALSAFIALPAAHALTAFDLRPRRISPMSPSRSAKTPCC